MLPKHHFSKKRKGNRHISGWGEEGRGAADARKEISWTQQFPRRHKHASLHKHISPPVCIVRGFLRSLFLVSIKQRPVLSLLNSVWFWILDITEVRPLPSSWLDLQKNAALSFLWSSAFIRKLYHRGWLSPYPPPVTFLPLQVSIYSLSSFCFLVFWFCLLFFSATFKNSLPFFNFDAITLYLKSYNQTEQKY